MIGTIAANLEAHRTGALNIDGCRIGYDPNDTNPATNPLHRKQAGYANGNAADHNSSSFSLKDGSGERNPNSGGRWPANVIHDGSREVAEAFPQANGQQGAVGPQHGARPSVNCYGDYGPRDHFAPRGDAGSAARFFYSAKADAADRCGSKHPTVKPIDLMAYLCRLVTPPGGVVLDPFAGSGSTGMACLREGFDCVLIEREAQYVEDIHRRLKHVEGADTPLFANDAEPSLFGEVA
jgi:site-specific DNA-methyltransferase (adenine-specific)